MATIRSIQDVVDYRLCMGCGACVYVIGRDSGRMVDIPNVGLRPTFSRQLRAEEQKKALSVCPGVRVETPAGVSYHNESGKTFAFDSRLVGRGGGLWEGYASDPEIRAQGSSGGVVTALSQYCIEKLAVDFVSHVGMAREKPWTNSNILSRTRAELGRGLGSRYAASSPCLSLSDIETTESTAVFVGKPCDAAAVAAVLKQNPKLQAKVAAVISFFCAGTPTSAAASELLQNNRIQLETLDSVTFRGEGWPGRFRAINKHDEEVLSLSYSESWEQLQPSRGLRCSLCADGLGEVADIACGDAWHHYANDGNPGVSVVIARSVRGKEIIEGAMAAGYLSLREITVTTAISSQAADAGLMKRRGDLWGRLLVLRFLGIPTPRYNGFRLFGAWLEVPTRRKARSLLGTLARVFRKRLFTRATAVSQEGD